MRKTETAIFSLLALFFGGTLIASSHIGIKTLVAQKEDVEVPATILPTQAIAEKVAAPRYIRPLSDARLTLKAEAKRFIEIYLPEKTIYLHKEDGVVDEIPIMATGDPQGWGGSPAGLYQVLYKNDLAYSSIAEAYMPYAIHFYGKYFIHGEPYYADGTKIRSDFSGGCIRIADTAIPYLYKEATAKTPVLVIDKEYDTFTYPRQQTPLQNISAQSYLIADIDSGEVLAEKNATTPHPIASITKLMTALVVAEHTDLRKSTIATTKALTAYGSTSGLSAGTSYRLVELLYPLLVESSNDSAEVLTTFLGRTETINRMNAKATHLFMKNTTYTDPSGFDAGNKSSAEDLYLLARYISNNRNPLWTITKGEKTTTFGPVRFQTATLFNKNEFHTEENFIGGKTGYIHEAKHTGVFVFEVEIGETTRRIAFVVLQSESSERDIATMKKWVTDTYSPKSVI